MDSIQILRADLLDIIFENRNKAYGAYELRRRYQERLGIGLLVTGLFGLALFISTAIMPQKLATAKPRIVPVAPDMLPPDYMDKKEKTEQQQTQKKAVRTEDHVTIRVVPNDSVKTADLVPEFGALDSAAVGSEKLDGEVVKAGSMEKGGTEGIGKEAEKPQPAAEVFLPIEQEAEFPGGAAAWLRYVSLEIERNMDALQEDGRSGTVVVMFVVDKDGQVADVHVLPCKEAGIPNCMGPDSELAAIAIAAVKRGPRWKPAQQNGMSVRAYRRQPVTLKMW